MLTVDEARKKGIRACMEKLGYDFCMRHADTSSTAYGSDDDIVFCFVGVNDRPDAPERPEVLILSEVKFPYSASCNVNRTTEDIEFLECRVPDETVV